MRIELKIIIFLSILIIFLTIFSTFYKTPQLTQGGKEIAPNINFIKNVSETTGIILANKPKLKNYIPNADLTFQYDGWLSQEDIPLEFKDEPIIQQTFGFKSNGFATNDEFKGRKGIVVLHPVDTNKPRYLETPEFLLPDSGFLVIGFANRGFGSSDDNVFKVYLIDTNKKLSIKIDEFVISGKDGWKDIAYPIKTLLSEFSNKKVKVRVEGWAGGQNIWMGEWGIIDYIDIVDSI